METTYVSAGWLEITDGLGSAVGGGAALAGLLFIGWQVTLARMAVQASVVQSLGTEIIQMGQWLVNDSDRRKLLYLPEDQTSEESKAVAVVVVDFISHVLSQKRNIPKDQLEAWKRYFLDMLSERPQVRNFLESHGDWYGKEMQGLMLQYKERSQKS